MKPCLLRLFLSVVVGATLTIVGFGVWRATEGHWDLLVTAPMPAELLITLLVWRAVITMKTSALGLGSKGAIVCFTWAILQTLSTLLSVPALALALANDGILPTEHRVHYSMAVYCFMITSVILHSRTIFRDIMVSRGISVFPFERSLLIQEDIKSAFARAPFAPYWFYQRTVNAPLVSIPKVLAAS